MRTIHKNGHTIVLYDGIEEMPVVRYNKYTKYSVLGAGVGNTIDDIVSRLGELRAMVGRKDMEKRLDSGILTLAQTFHFCANCVDPSTLAFSSLVKSIDGEECTDTTDDGIERVREKVSQILTREDVVIALSGVKKKSTGNWLSTFLKHTGARPTWRRKP